MQTVTVQLDRSTTIQQVDPYFLGGNLVASTYNMLWQFVQVCKAQHLKGMTWRVFQKDDYGWKWDTNTFDPNDWRRKKTWLFFAGDSADGYTEDIDEKMALHRRFHVVDPGNRWEVDFKDAAHQGHSLRVQAKDRTQSYRKIACRPLREGFIRWDIKAVLPLSNVVVSLRDEDGRPLIAYHPIVAPAWDSQEYAFSFDRPVHEIWWGLVECSQDTEIHLDDLRVSDEPIDTPQPYWERDYHAYFDANDTLASVDDIIDLAQQVDAKIIWTIPLRQIPSFAWQTPDYYAGLAEHISQRLDTPIFELGNEPYFDGQWANDVAGYYTRCRQYQATMVQANRLARFGVHTDRRHPQAWLNHIHDSDDWDFYSLFHDYPFKLNKPERHWTNIWSAYGNTYAYWVGNKGDWTDDPAVAGQFLYGPEQIQAIQPGTPIYQTEIGYFVRSGAGEDNWHGSALNLASAWGRLLEKGVAIGCKWTLNSRGFGFGLTVTLPQRPWLELPPHFEVFKLFSRYLLPDMIAATVTASTVDEVAFNFSHNPGDQFNLPGFNVWAFKDGDRTHVFLLNTSDEPIHVQGLAAPNKVHQLSAASLYKDNEVRGKGSSLLWFAPASDGSTDPNQVRLQTSDQAGPLPPHSITCWEFGMSEPIDPPDPTPKGLTVIEQQPWKADTQGHYTSWFHLMNQSTETISVQTMTTSQIDIVIPDDHFILHAGANRWVRMDFEGVGGVEQGPFELMILGNEVESTHMMHTVGLPPVVDPPDQSTCEEALAQAKEAINDLTDQLAQSMQETDRQTQKLEKIHKISDPLSDPSDG